MIAKMLGIPTQGIDILGRGLEKQFITSVEEEKLKFLKTISENPDPELKLHFPIKTTLVKPFY